MRVQRNLAPWLLWLLLTFSTATAVAIVIGPAWYVQPFSPQTEQGLDRALALREISPLATIIAFTLCVLLAGMLWRGTRRWWRIPLVAAPVIAAGAALLARFNHFEAMFEPLPIPQFAATRDVDFITNESRDMVLAVEHEGDAVAFPVRQMAYHHVVQEDVGGIPVVATY